MPRTSKGTHLKQSGDIWYIHWCEGGRTKRRSTGACDRKEAELALAGFLLEKDKPADQADTPVSFFLDDYWNEHGSKLASAPSAEFLLAYLREFFGAHPVSALGRALVTEYGTWRRRERDISNGTLRRELGVLVAALNHAALEKRLDARDIPHIPLPPEPASKDRWLTHEEAQRLRETRMSSRARLFVEIALATSARKRAIEELTWFQVDLENRLINFNPPGRQQTKKRRAHVPISSTLLPLLVEAKARATSEFVLGNNGSIRKTFATAMARAGLKDVTPHTLRHTYATWAAMAGVRLESIADVLGDDPRTVYKRYRHLQPDYLRHAVDFDDAEKRNERMRT
jgi:integrase